MQYQEEAGRLQAAPALDSATDFAYLQSLGYPAERVRGALSATRGDRAGALHILQKGGGLGKDASAWRAELKDDFSSGAATTNLPASTESRALWRTPLYIRVGEPRMRNGKTFFTLSVVKKNGESWKIERSYSEFLKLKSSLPLFTTVNFKNPFPPKNDLMALFSSVNVETRRRALEEWMREMCMSEDCMKNDIILRLLGDFVEECKQQPPPAVLGIATLPSTPAGGMMRYGGTAPHTGGALGSPTSSLTSLQTTKGPLSLEQFRRALPCKIPVVDNAMPQASTGEDDLLERGGGVRASSLRFYSLDPSAPSIGDGGTAGGRGEEGEGSMFHEVQPAGLAGLDYHSTAMKQLQKDFSRDRVILQGNTRIEGSSHELAKIVAAMQQAVAALLDKAGKPPLSETISAGFFISILGALSRTESAYLAHASLTSVLCNSEDGNLLCVVPESSLADPIKVNFRLKEREVGGRDWCIVCEGEAATVFRLNDAETEDLSTLLQVKTTFFRTVFGMPRLGARGEVVELVEKAGAKPMLVLEREMRSTARDWGGGNPF